MKKLTKRSFIFTFILLVCVVCFSFLPFGANTAYAASNIKDTNVHFNSVVKDIVINENKVCDITETITVTFQRGGINVGLSRNVSRINLITVNKDGKNYVTKTVNKLVLKSVTLDGEDEFAFVEISGDYFYINTGEDYDYKSAGKHTYVIHYTYDMGEDFINEFDSFTFDVMDYGFRNKVDSFSASITLPKEFVGDSNIEDILSFRTNEKQALGYEAVDFHMEDNTIHCSLEGLGSYEGLTMQLLLPEDYFITSYSPNGNYYAIIGLLVFSLVAILGIVLFSVIYRKKGIVKTVEFYPPKGFNPIDVAKIYRGKALPKDFAGLVIEWASKGLVDIEIKSKRQIILTKLKDFPEIGSKDANAKGKRDERRYFNAMFAKSDTFDTKEKIKNAKNTNLQLATQKLYKNSEKQTRKIFLSRLAIHVLAALPMIFFIVWLNSISASDFVPLFFLLFIEIAICVFLYTPMPWTIIWFKIIWCGLFGGAPLGMIVSTYNFSCDIFHLVWICPIFMILASALGLLVKFSPKENKDVLGKILGFKEFLVTAELDKLEMMIAENPTYYYDILPYCYVFGITKKMEEKFKALHVENPSYCNDGYSMVVVGHCIGSSLSHSGAASSSSGGHGGGGGGGGGSSGGGGGGGGCGGR